MDKGPLPSLLPVCQGEEVEDGESEGHLQNQGGRRRFFVLQRIPLCPTRTGVQELQVDPSGPLLGRASGTHEWSDRDPVCEDLPTSLPPMGSRSGVVLVSTQTTETLPV